jgi:glycosyltransferase involved in cell wall biosynthesis
MKLSVIIPVYNEAKRLPKALTICRRRPNWEFIFVSDGSTDQTNSLIRSAGYKLIAYPANRGKGFALKQGVASAGQPLILITDVDFSTPLSELPKLAAKIAGADIVIGSRKTAGAQILRRQPALREFLGRQFTNLTNFWLGTKVSDITCGFKLFQAPVAKKLFALSKINRWGYDAEILFLAKKLHYRVAEVPVKWKNDPNTKVNLIKDIFRSITDLILIKFCHLNF